MNDNVTHNSVAPALPEASAVSQEQWRAMCLQLLADKEAVQGEVPELRKQRQRLLDALFPEDVKEVTLSKEELLAQLVTEPPMDEFIDNLEKSWESTPQ